MMNTDIDFDIYLEKDLFRILGNRLLGWSVISLWATTVVVVFRAFSDFPAIVDSLLFWVLPLMVVRGIAGAVIHKELAKPPCFAPPLTNMKRMAVLFGLSDGLLLLAALVIFGRGSIVAPDVLVIVVVTALALLSLVYMFVPNVLLLVNAVALLPTLLMAFLSEQSLPIAVIVTGACILVVTHFGVLKSRQMYMKQAMVHLRFEQEIDQASESNFIFNQHWQKTPLAAIDWDSNFAIRSWNPAAQRLFGYSQDEALGQPLSLLFADKVAAQVETSWRQADTLSSELRMIRTAVNKQGADVRCEWYDTLLNLDGDFIGIASFIVEPMTAEPASTKPVQPH